MLIVLSHGSYSSKVRHYFLSDQEHSLQSIFDRVEHIDKNWTAKPPGDYLRLEKIYLEVLAALGFREIKVDGEINSDYLDTFVCFKRDGEGFFDAIASEKEWEELNGG